jgi:23S rRNA pseudouridine955/2504/2580 synthase/23S rRNA pseudouridine1911/1915/1917 synthase
MKSFTILFEDDSIIVIDKEAGLMVEPDRNGYPNLLQQVKNHIKATLPGGVELYAQHIHRLDRPVSGVILFAKRKSVLKNLSEQFAERKVKKYYQALTEKAPDIKVGMIAHWHRKEKKKAALYIEEVPYSEKAKLAYEVVKQENNLFLWNIELHTGKYHQIRAQLSQLGCPIVGDSLYGSTLPYQENAIALHACKLIFSHPISNQEMIVTSQKYFEL